MNGKGKDVSLTSADLWKCKWNHPSKFHTSFHSSSACLRTLRWCSTQEANATRKLSRLALNQNSREEIIKLLRSNAGWFTHCCFGNGLSAIDFPLGGRDLAAAQSGAPFELIEQMSPGHDVFSCYHFLRKETCLVYLNGRIYVFQMCSVLMSLLSLRICSSVAVKIIICDFFCFHGP